MFRIEYEYTCVDSIERLIQYAGKVPRTSGIRRQQIRQKQYKLYSNQLEVSTVNDDNSTLAMENQQNHE
jgi:hypothetical protein